MGTRTLSATSSSKRRSWFWVKIAGILAVLLAGPPGLWQVNAVQAPLCRKIIKHGPVRAWCDDKNQEVSTTAATELWQDYNGRLLAGVPAPKVMALYVSDSRPDDLRSSIEQIDALTYWSEPVRTVTRDGEHFNRFIVYNRQYLRSSRSAVTYRQAMQVVQSGDDVKIVSLDVKNRIQDNARYVFPLVWINRATTVYKTPTTFSPDDINFVEHADFPPAKRDLTASRLSDPDPATIRALCVLNVAAGANSWVTSADYGQWTRVAKGWIKTDATNLLKPIRPGRSLATCDKLALTRDPRG